MANIQTRITTDNRIMYTARIRIKGYPHQSLAYTEGSNCTEDHQFHDERQPAKKHAAILSANLAQFLL